MNRLPAGTRRIALWITFCVALATLSALVVSAPINCLPALWRPASLRCVAASAAGPSEVGLDDPVRRDMTMMLISSAENSTLRWEEQFAYIEYNVEGDDAENRGYTGGLVGFTSRTHDMLELVEAYEEAAPANPLSPFLGALRAVDGTPSREGLGEPFMAAWREAARDPAFQAAQLRAAEDVYLHPAIRQAKADGLRALGQFIYVDALVMHGPGEQPRAFHWIRARALDRAASVDQGGDEVAYLDAFLDVREEAMVAEVGHHDTTRVSTGQRRFLRENNLDLTAPLRWSVYGDDFEIRPGRPLRCALGIC